MSKISRKTCIIALMIAVLALTAIEIIKPSPFDDAEINRSFQAIISRAVGAALFILIAIYLGYDIFGLKKAINKKALFALPCLIVALNNLPYVALMRGDAMITGAPAEIYFFILECIFVALFEEVAFRGVLYLTLQKGRTTRRGLFFSVIVSSVVFGLFHLINLFYGASIGQTALQVGYSFLVGCMCAFVLIKTGSIWYCVIIHAIYNFCGQIVSRLGAGEMLNAPQIIITVIISLLCAIYIVIILFKSTPDDVGGFYISKE
ncbi:MAG: CPBP family intramembrane metalloprotease [Clostridia bacterium]|nr:CPBP family intramembrane metalloprotease [Clostridia bacterium]